MHELNSQILIALKINIIYHPGTYMYFKHFSALWLYCTVQADFEQEERVGKGGHSKGDIHMNAAALVGFGPILNMLAQILGLSNTTHTL